MSSGGAEYEGVKGVFVTREGFVENIHRHPMGNDCPGVIFDMAKI